MNGFFPYWVRGGLIFRIGELQLADRMPKKVFLRETIEKEVRLSYLKRIQQTLPEDYLVVFPEKPDIEKWGSISGTQITSESSLTQTVSDKSNQVKR
jgi:MIF4G like